jgi:hypothetical protein
MKKALIAGLLGCTLCVPALAANIILNNVDTAGVGFNDATPASPVGGNTGTTVGSQRLIAYQKALELWGKTLHSDATIVVRGSFARLDCTASGGVLAQAGALQIFSDFPNAPLPGHWYGVALANAIAGTDLTPGPLDIPGPGDLENDDIIANFNGALGAADCLVGSTWYYGLDSSPGPNQIDFLDTFMHEVAHGLGFQNFANEATGGLFDGLPDVYMANTLDLDLGMWNTLSSPQIVTSAVKNGRIVWAGPNVTAFAPSVLGPAEGIKVFGTLNREVAFGTAAFGALPNAGNFSGQIVLVNDGVGVVTDGCETITTNLTGKVALIDRGACGFVLKVKNAQNAGAKAVIIANTLLRAEFGMSGSDPTITIPSIGISNADGDAIKAALPNESAVYFVDKSRRAGMAAGFVRLYAPTVVALGSSISHFDITATPNLLMEPFSTPDTRANTTVDLTAALMKDIGWQIESLKIGSCDTGVPATLSNGVMLHAQVDACAATSGNNAQFQTCVDGVVKAAQKSNQLNGSQRSNIMQCTKGGRSF